MNLQKKQYHQQIRLTPVLPKSTSDKETGEGDVYVPNADNSPHLLGQAVLNELVRDMELKPRKKQSCLIPDFKKKISSNQVERLHISEATT